MKYEEKKSYIALYTIVSVVVAAIMLATKNNLFFFFGDFFWCWLPQVGMMGLIVFLRFRAAVISGIRGPLYHFGLLNKHAQGESKW